MSTTKTLTGCTRDRLSWGLALTESFSAMVSLFAAYHLWPSAAPVELVGTWIAGMLFGFANAKFSATYRSQK